MTISGLTREIDRSGVIGVVVVLGRGQEAARMAGPTRVALITGGSRGLGAAIGGRLARAGWAIGLLARTRSELEETAAALRRDGGDAWPLIADVREAGQVVEACARLLHETGKIDVLVHAAGALGAIGPTQLVDPADWRRDFETSTLGFYHAYRAAATWLGRSSAAAAVALIGPGYHAELAHASAYAAGQAALVRLVETLAAEQPPDRLPVYAVYPGLVPTRLIQNLLDRPEGRRWLPRFIEAFAEGKEAGPEVVAEMVHWLLDRRPPELTGRVIPALQTPEILETRLPRIVADDLGRLRIR